VIRALAIACALAGVAQADSRRVALDTPPVARRVVVLASDSADTGLVARARAELTSLGFEVTVEPPSDTPLDELSATDHAVAALRIAHPAGSIEVYCLDPATQQTIVRQVLIGAEGDGSVVLVRAVELVRASLLQVAARHVAEVHATAPPPSEPDHPLVSIEGGPAIVGSRGGIGSSTNISLAVRWHPTSYLEIGASVLLPTSASEVRGMVGFADIKVTVPAVEANVIAPTFAGFEVRGGLGAGVVRMTMHGVAAAAIYTGREDSVTTGLGFARVSIGHPIIDRVRVWLDVRAAVAAPRPTVVFADEPVASWGRPAVIGGLGIDVVLR
jgi:hypothetical protein